MFTITATKNLKRRLGEGAIMPANGKVQRIMSSLPDRMMPKQQAAQEQQHPDTIAQELQRQHTKTTIDPPSYKDLDHFFHAPTQAEIDAYQHDILAAVRGSHVETLRQFHKEGRPMKCSNEFGESILHLACRKGLTTVAKFLVEEGNVPVQVCDDYGRNPLHDACWVHQPNFELMDLILGKCPDLLYIKDRRGHTPLSFARRDQWKLWNDYLKTKDPQFVAPNMLLQRQKTLGNSSTSSTNPGTPSLNKKRPSVTVAASGIKIPTFEAPVAAKGIQIPTLPNSEHLKNTISASAALQMAQVQATALKMHKRNSAPPTVGAGGGGLNVLLQASQNIKSPLSSPVAKQQHQQLNALLQAASSKAVLGGPNQQQPAATAG